MEITIGVKHGVRELVIGSPLSADEATKIVKTALAGNDVLELDDERGGHYVIPTSTIGFVHIDSAQPRTVGFGSI